ncbi:MAG: DNA ligase [Myxococcota bacterium]
MQRRLEYVEGTSSKFWEYTVEGAELTVRWGRIGTSGMAKVTAFATPAQALADGEKQAAKKIAKGYAEPGTAAPSAPAASTAPAPTGPDALADGEEVVVQGSSSSTYTIRNTGGVFSCTCPAWRHQSIGIERRTCKHIRALRGEAAEQARLGALPEPAVSVRAAKEGAPKVLLAHSWEDQDPTGWWMSEKLDGVRAWWDGTQFLSRLGNPFVAPDWFVASLPSHPLDGELFGGRGRFQDTVSIARRTDRSDQWRELAFVVFDVPEHGGPFEARLEHARSLELGAFAHVLEHRICEGRDHLVEELRQVEALRGEGLMLRRPGSRYVAGRSDSLLKVKTFHDAEATVVGHLGGTGKHRGRLGALEVALPDGTRFKVGTGFSDAEREDPPPVGTIITFRYQELTRAGVPRFPTYLRVRPEE